MFLKCTQFTCTFCLPGTIGSSRFRKSQCFSTLITKEVKKKFDQNLA